MPADPVLVLSGLVLAHLVADFVLQTERIVRDKGASGRRAWRGLVLHGLGVAACLVPVAIVFGAPGWTVLAVVAVSHVIVDRAKVLATRRAEARALAEAHARHADHRRPAGTDELATSLGPAWTPLPAALFALDQAVHLVILVVAWAVWLADAVPLPGAVAAVEAIIGRWDPAVVNRLAVAAVVLAGLVIVNVRAGALFVAILVRPREAVSGTALAEPGTKAARSAHPPAWRLRIGPFEATAEPAAPRGPGPAGQAPGNPGPRIETSTRHASPVRVGATIGVLERLLIVALMLTGAQAAVGFVVAAKTIARFRQLDDRDFAEYYLLGTLASVAVAIGSALVADASLATVGL